MLFQSWVSVEIKYQLYSVTVFLPFFILNQSKNVEYALWYFSCGVMVAPKLLHHRKRKHLQKYLQTLVPVINPALELVEMSSGDDLVDVITSRSRHILRGEASFNVI